MRWWCARGGRGRDRGGQKIVIATGTADRDEAVRASRPWIRSPSRHYTLARLWNHLISKDTLEKNTTTMYYSRTIHGSCRSERRLFSKHIFFRRQSIDPIRSTNVRSLRFSINSIKTEKKKRKKKEKGAIDLIKIYLQDGYATSNDHVVADILHDTGSLSSDQGQQHRRLVKVPEEEELTTRRGRAAHVAKQIGGRIPEDPFEAQHHLT